MLLKAIEEKRFYPMGANKEVASDLLIIAGTHRDLRGRVGAIRQPVRRRPPVVWCITPGQGAAE